MRILGSDLFFFLLLLLFFFFFFFKAIKQQLTFFLTVYVFGSCFRTLAVIFISDYFYVDEYIDVLIHEWRLHLTWARTLQYKNNRVEMTRINTTKSSQRWISILLMLTGKTTQKKFRLEGWRNAWSYSSELQSPKSTHHTFPWINILQLILTSEPVLVPAA